MNISWNHYRYIAADASILFHPLPDTLKTYLMSGCVATADTFSYEITAYHAVVSDSQLTDLHENLKLIAKARRVDPLFNRKDYQDNYLNQDIYGLVCLMSGTARHCFPAKQRSLLLTADLSLTEQLATENIPIDIYLVGVDRLYTPQDFPVLLHDLNPDPPDSRQLTPIRVVPRRDLTVYRSDGTEVLLTAYYEKDQGEAHIFDSCSISPAYVAKIFRAKFLTAGKIRHIQKLIFLNRLLNLCWTLFPIELLYADPDAANPVGYVMLRAGGLASISEVVDVQNAYPLTLEPEKRERILARSYINYLHLSLMLTRQCLLLSTYGVHPGDYNPKNFSEFDRQDKRLRSLGIHTGLLYMWDTDSFDYKSYTSNRWWSLDLVPVNDNYSASLRCAEALYQAVFRMLTLGMCPFYRKSKDQCVPRFNTVSPQFRHQFFYIPENLRHLFHDVLFCNQLPSIPRLVTELTIALEQAHAEDLHVEDADFRADVLVDMGAPFWEPPNIGSYPPRRLPIPSNPMYSSPAPIMRHDPFSINRAKKYAGSRPDVTAAAPKV